MGPLEYIVFKATGSTTGGAFELLELTVQPGGGPPDHLHRQHDETYYLFDGTFRFSFRTFPANGQGECSTGPNARCGDAEWAAGLF